MKERASALSLSTFLVVRRDMRLVLSFALVLLSHSFRWPCSCHGFSTSSAGVGILLNRPTTTTPVPTFPTVLLAESKHNNNNNNNNNNVTPHWLMAEYRDPTTGEILDPYKVLKVNRKADRQEIKQAYRALSRRYHPDVMIHRDILPGSCNNLQDVRNHWERVKLSYEILKDPLRRKRYDRNIVLSDPGRAVQRAATEAALDAVMSAGKGVWGIGTSIGSSVLEGVSKAAEKARQEAVARKQKEKEESQKHQPTPMTATTMTTPTADSVSSIMKWQPDQRDGGNSNGKAQELEETFRLRIDDTLVEGPALFRNPEKKKNRGLRSLYDFGLLPISKTATTTTTTTTNSTVIQPASY